MFSDLSGSVFLSVAFCSLVYNVITPSVRGGAANDTAPPQGVYPRYLCTADTLSNVRPSLFTFSIIRWCLPPTRSSMPTCSPAASSRSRMFSTHCRALACGPKFVDVLAYTLPCVRTFENLPAPPAVLTVCTLAGLDVQEFAYVKSRRQRLVVFSCP